LSAIDVVGYWKPRENEEKKMRAIPKHRAPWAGAGAGDVRRDDRRFGRDGEERERTTSGIWVGAGIRRVRE
jgi:hypothetical protein